MPEDRIETLDGQECPICHQKTCTLTQMDRYIPFGGKDVLIYVFSMNCSNCRYRKADVEFAEKHDPAKVSIDVQGDEDMKIMVVRSGEGTVKIPRIGSIEGGPASNGFITTVEGILKRFYDITETAKENSDDEEEKKKAKNLMKKLTRIMWGKDKCRIIIEDKTGNSDILSDKAVKTKI